MSAVLKNVTEEEVQRAIIDGLSVLGYIVEQTSVRVAYAKCPVCATKVKPRSPGTSFGVPDLLIRLPIWPTALRLGLEVKKPVGWKWTNDEQRLKWERGETMKAHSLEQACFAVQHFERHAIGRLSRSEVVRLASTVVGEQKREVVYGLL